MQDLERRRNILAGVVYYTANHPMVTFHHLFFHQDTKSLDLLHRLIASNRAVLLALWPNSTAIAAPFPGAYL
jgi:hypothetical protein